MKKNLIIAVLALFLALSLTLVQFLTNRYNAAINYINDLESYYSDYVDTISEDDAYSEWYNY